jgi:terminase small subunit-like protein
MRSTRKLEHRKNGRPSIYSEVLTDEICQRLAEGESLRSICRDPVMPARSTVMLWLRNRKGFSDHYAHAREMCCDYWADQIIDICDDSSNDWVERDGRTIFNREHFERSRLRVDARKWLLSKLLPKKYGTRVRIDGNGRDGQPVGLRTETKDQLIHDILSLIQPKPDPDV